MPDSKRFLVGCSNGQIKLCEINGRCSVASRNCTTCGEKHRPLPDNKHVLSSDSTIRLFDVVTNEVLRFHHHKETVSGFALLADSRRFASASFGGTVALVEHGLLLQP